MSHGTKIRHGGGGFIKGGWGKLKDDGGAKKALEGAMLEAMRAEVKQLREKVAARKSVALTRGASGLREDSRKAGRHGINLKWIDDGTGGAAASAGRGG